MENRDKASYCIGFEAGEHIAGRFAELNIEQVKQGFHDAIEKVTPALDFAERQKITANLLLHMQESQKFAIEHINVKNQKEGAAFLRTNKSKPEVTSLPSGLQYKILKSSSEGISPNMYDTVQVHFRGSSLNGVVFVDTYESNMPQSIQMNNCLPGFCEALKKMKIGDKWQLYIPAHLAFGDKGNSQFNIAPGAALIVDMELLTIARPLRL